MKLSLTFLALAVATVQADLTSKWNLDYVDAGKTGDVYTFNYNNIGNEMLIDPNMVATVMTGDCAGVPLASNTAGTPTVGTEVTAVTIGYTGGSANDGVAIVGVTLDPGEAAKTGMWTAIGEEGGGEMSFCVRYGLFAGANEINFAETIVTLTITMEGGFVVESFDVAEKDCTASTQTQSYAVTAALCSSGDGQYSAFLQGNLICVLVAPDSSDVVVTSISAFTWSNGAQTQIALPLAGGDGLTSYETAVPATFSTILYAQFYETGNLVYGSGSANLGFATARRLGNGRTLQEIDAADAVQDFSIVADIVKSDDAPTALQTAGGATASFIVTIFGLVGAVLLA